MYPQADALQTLEYRASSVIVGFTNSSIVVPVAAFRGIGAACLMPILIQSLRSNDNVMNTRCDANTSRQFVEGPETQKTLGYLDARKQLEESVLGLRFNYPVAKT